jgi:hypothetical protein
LNAGLESEDEITQFRLRCDSSGKSTDTIQAVAQRGGASAAAPMKALAELDRFIAGLI